MEPIETFMRGLEADDLDAVGEFLTRDPGFLTRLAQEPSCSMPALAAVRSVPMADLLIGHGADLRKVSEWWAPGFWLDRVLPPVAEHLVHCGAEVTPHAAAGLGLLTKLRQMLDEQPELVHAKGGDGCRPLHFSRDAAIAELLVERGAEIDAKDEDHDSTAAQWRIGDAPDVTRFLLERGCTPDIFMAAGLGDRDLATSLVNEHPECTTYRIGNNKGPFPGIGFKKRGGTIYQWSLGFNQSPHEIAHKREYLALYNLLMSYTPPREQLLVACMLADRRLAGELARRHPEIVPGLDEEDRALLAKSCWETNLNIDAVRLMLDLGFPVSAPEFNHGYTPLHNAAWCGDPVLVDLLLQHGHPVNQRDPNFQSTPLGFALHSCLEAKRHPEGDFPKVVELLLRAGATIPDKAYPTGHAGLDAALKQFGRV